MAFILGPVVKGLGAGIGLGREAYLHHKDKRDEQSRLQLPEVTVVEIQVDETEETDERDWDLDEATAPDTPLNEELESSQNEISEAEPSTEAIETPTMKSKSVQLVEGVIRLASPPPTITHDLACPVVLPQRRPGSKERGFVRAYAPDLAASGINQDSWLQFLENFDRASQASPALVALYTSAMIVGMVPGTITMAVGVAVSMLAGTAMQLETRYKANQFLDGINRDLFMPRGLYVMVMRYRPEKGTPGQTEIGVESLNTETTKSIAKWAPASLPDAEFGLPTAGKKFIKHIRLASGTTKGDEMLPAVCAQLVFPKANASSTALSRTTSASPAISPLSPTSSINEAPSPSSLSSKAKRTKAFVADYFDRRAQAEFLAKNPTTRLSEQVSPPVFRSRYADPTNNTNHHLFNLVSGGKANAQTLGIEGRRRRQAAENEKRAAQGLPPLDEARGPVGLVVKGVKKVLKEDLLYLTVVNMPSDEDMARARQLLAENGWK